MLAVPSPIAPSAAAVARSPATGSSHCPLSAPIVPVLGSAAFVAWRQGYRRHRLGGIRGAAERGEALWQSSNARKNISSFEQHKDELRASTSERSAKADIVLAAQVGGSPSGIKAHPSWDDLERVQILATEWRLAYRRCKEHSFAF